jgi:hypothetical protein
VTYPKGSPPGLLRRDKSRPRAQKRVKHARATLGAILDGVDHETGRLHGRMHLEFANAIGAEGIYARVIPHIAAVEFYARSGELRA